MEADLLDFLELQRCAVPKKTLSGILHLFHPLCKHTRQRIFQPLTCMTLGLPEGGRVLAQRWPAASPR